MNIKDMEYEIENVFNTFVYPQNIDIIDDLINQLQYQFNLNSVVIENYKGNAKKVNEIIGGIIKNNVRK